MNSKEFKSLTTSTVLEFIDKGYDSLAAMFTYRPTELVDILNKRELTPGPTDDYGITTELVAVITSDLEFIGYLKGCMVEAHMEWERKGTSETAYRFLYYYDLLFNEVYTKMLDEKTANWQDTLERYLKHDIEAVTLLYGDGLEMYYDERKEKWVACAPSGELMSIYHEQEGESIV